MTPFEEITALLPGGLREEVCRLPEDTRRNAEELRLRTGYPPCVSVRGKEQEAPGSRPVRSEDLYHVLEQASRYSVHTVFERVRSGFVTVRGGHRIGLCGLAAIEDGTVTSFRQLSSLNLRIAREVKGAARGIVPGLLKNGRLQNTLILAPPGAGKTTLLRDLIRCISEGDGLPAMRVGVADERGELAALWEGRAQMELGRRTDILDGVPKGNALLMLLRGMNPQVLAVDEITDPMDVNAVVQAAGCGVTLLATVHGRNLQEMCLRPVYRELLRQNIFSCVVLLEQGEDGIRKLKVEDIPWYE